MLALLSLLGISLTGFGFLDFDDDDTAPDQPNPAPDDTGDSTDTGPDILTDSAPFPASAPDTPGADWISMDDAPGSNGYDHVMVGGQDDQNVMGSDGADYADGAGGQDVLQGGAGNDKLLGGTGDDRVFGGTGDDVLFGGAGNDAVLGGAGNDQINGGTGNDVLSGGAGDDSLHGMWGNNILDGGAGQDTLMGGRGDDVLYGRDPDAAEQDYLNGGSGNDHIIAGAGDIANGGAGADTFVIEAANGVVTVDDFNPDEDRLEVEYQGTVPVITTQLTDSGTDVMADGTTIAVLKGVTDFDPSTIGLLAR